jgi:protoporphyrinogen/coproporphyrinogen III oxidase
MDPASALPTSTDSPPSSPTRRRVAIVGGGIAGLAAAHRLTEIAPGKNITLFEAGSRVGGVLGTEHNGGWLIERAADMFITRQPWAVDLCRRIGIVDDLIPTDARFRGAFVVRRGRLVRVPAGFALMSPAKVWPIVTTPLLSPLGKARLAWERFVPARRGGADESLESFAVRRFGRETFDRLIQPLIGGIYTADPSKLSMAATLPQFLEMERQHGSVTRGFKVQGSGARGWRSASGGKAGGESGARYGEFVAPRLGMQQLVDAIAARLPAGCIRLNAPVERIELCRERPPWRSGPADNSEASGCGWHLFVGGQTAPQWFDDLILATPGAVTARLLEYVDKELAAFVGQIPYAGCAVAVLGARRDQIAHPLDGFGFVVPAIENRRILAGSLTSIKFPGRAPEGNVLLRIFIGGALQPHFAALGDDEIRTLVREELAELIGLSGEPEFCEVVRWHAAMPQYHVGHLDLVAKIEARAATRPNLALAGNAYRGVGIPFCIQSGEQAAERSARVQSI